MKTIDIIAGARPNFMKIAPIIRELDRNKEAYPEVTYRLIHTGQHYDKNMSSQFFDELNIPVPHFNFGVGSGTQAEQVGAIMLAYEKLLQLNKSDFCLVVGDVNSSMACSITAQKMQVQVGHVEGGIRSSDWRMPEEINRIVTDSISNWFFTTSEFANKNLLSLGVKKKQIFFVGNTMIDTLLSHMQKFKKPVIFDEAQLNPRSYLVLTMHRPNNVDQKDKFFKILSQIIACSKKMPIVFPVHPRTKKVLSDFGLLAPNLYLTDPLSYLEFNYLVNNAFAVITDSGGITEETTVMGVPCLTARDNTERPETISIGTNELIGTNPEKYPAFFEKLFSKKWKSGRIPPLWDGNAAVRIVKIISQILKETIRY